MAAAPEIALALGVDLPTEPEGEEGPRMMFRRPLVVRRRPLLRAAVVGGGAYALGRHQAKAQAAEEVRFEDLEERTAGAEQAAFSSRQAEHRAG
jgi:hypothetical protein